MQESIKPGTLSSLTGLNSYAAFIPFAFVPAGLELGAALISGLTSWRLTFDICGVGQEMQTLSATQETSAALATTTSRGYSRPPCPPCPPHPPEDKNAGETPALQETSMPGRRPAIFFRTRSATRIAPPEKNGDIPSAQPVSARLTRSSL